MSGTSTTAVSPGDLKRLILARLEQRFSHAESAMMAEPILFGEMAGRGDHGIMRLLPGAYGPMEDQGTSPVVERTGRGCSRIVGSPGMLVAARATQMVIETAHETGVAVVSTTGSRSTSGSLTYYAEQMTQGGLIAWVCANTIAMTTTIGGEGRLLGTNPVAFGIPTMTLPFIVDFSTSAISGGAVVKANADRVAIPPGVAVDKRGHATTDPGQVLDEGALLPFGGHKGMGLAMMIEILNGVIAGGGAAPVGADDTWGQVFVGLALESFGDPQALRKTAQDIVDRLAAHAGSPGSTTRIPGHGSLHNRDNALRRNAVEVDSTVYSRLVELVNG